MINFIERNESVITGKDNLEHLQTIENFPVFFGCTNKPPEEDLKCSMIWKIDKETGIIQLVKLIPLEILYAEQHVDAVGPTWSKYNEKFSNYILKNKIGDVIEIGGGSGKIAKIIVNKDSKVNYTVIEPSPLFEESNRLKIIKSFFKKELKDRFDKNNTIVFSQVYEHIYDPEGFLNEINEFLPLGGRIVFAYPNLEYWFKKKFTNVINFEHTILMTDYYVDYFLKKTGFSIIDKREYRKHSHFYTVEKISRGKERIYLKNKYKHYKNMFIEFVNHYSHVVENINSLISKTKCPIFLFGGHIFSQYLIMCGLDISKIICILDNSPLKQGKRLYGSSMIVKSPRILQNYKNPIIILNAGIYNNEIKKDITDNINNNAFFI